jgi:Protein of unknown function (DUF3455)
MKLTPAALRSPLPPLAAMALLLSACAALSPTADIPEPLQIPQSRAVEIVGARGVQIYECRAKKDNPGQAEWAFVAPEADLVDARGGAIGRHYAGPHWEAADGSRVAGSVMARSNAPSASDIPWLLLKASSTGQPGRFAGITHIQRINTRGGIAPASGCHKDNIGAAARVPYTTDYVMLSAR